MNIQHVLYFALNGFKTVVFGQRKPLIAGMPLTDVCNLDCRHCVVANTGRGHYSLARIEQTLRHFYALGVRIMYFQGGEIMTWNDGEKGVNDVVRLAREIGFFKVAVVTNGTMGIDSDADMMWVSLDGSRELHDSIRGEGVFDTVMRNLEITEHRRVALNMTINRINAGEVEKVAEIARRLTTVRGVSFNFHTPYSGVEEICLSMAERRKVIDTIVRLKRSGYPVLNTPGGLKALKANTWKRPLPMIQLMEKDRIYECCFGREQPGVCERCGYGIIAELSQVMRFNIPTMLRSVRLFG